MVPRPFNYSFIISFLTTRIITRRPWDIGYTMYYTVLCITCKIEPPKFEAILVAILLSSSYAINPDLFGDAYYLPLSYTIIYVITYLLY